MSNHPQRTDADLLDAAARAPEAFGELYDRYAAAAYGWARKAGLGEADALDLVAELFARAWCRASGFVLPSTGAPAAGFTASRATSSPRTGGEATSSCGRGAGSGCAR